MTNTTWREDMKIKICSEVKVFSHGEEEYGIKSVFPAVYLEEITDFIQQQINKAEEEGFTKGFHSSHEHDELYNRGLQEGQEKMKQTILEYIPEDRQNPDDYEKFFNLGLKHCRQCVTLASISSLPTNAQ